MNKNTLILILVSLGSLIAGIGLFNLSTPDPELAAVANKPVPQKPMSEISLQEIPLTDLDGNQKLIANWQQPVLIVNFWAPWCAPCREEVPALIALQDKFGDQVQVLGLALDSEENIRSFQTEYGMNYPSFIAGNRIPMYNAVFTNKSGSLPFTAIIDQQRKIYFTHSGQITEEQLKSHIAELL
ncbi:MAG: thiol-disulfide isomerase/thioredoxin [Gammaproteobacteria bacterium]|jgi:thiol-disulfide isomerase/thioredoxin